MSKIAWAAGFVDGEGCIQIVPHRNSHRLRLQVVSTTHAPLAKLQASFGGYLNGPYQGKPPRRPYWQWALDDDRAKAALRAMLPHLTVKRAQARLVLRFPTTGGGQKDLATGRFVAMSAGLRQQRANLALGLKELRR